MGKIKDAPNGIKNKTQPQVNIQPPFLDSRHELLALQKRLEEYESKSSERKPRYVSRIRKLESKRLDNLKQGCRVAIAFLFAAPK